MGRAFLSILWSSYTLFYASCLCFYAVLRLRELKKKKKKWSHKLIDPFIFIIKTRGVKQWKSIKIYIYFYKLFMAYLCWIFMLFLLCISFMERKRVYTLCCWYFMANGIEAYWRRSSTLWVFSQSIFIQRKLFHFDAETFES